MADRLPPLRISQAPRPASKADEWRRNVEQWAQDYHFALREIEKYLSGLDLTAPAVSEVVGPPGPPGPRGPAGRDGDDGDDGDDLQGDDGPAGANGRTWHVGVGAPSSGTLSTMAVGDFYLDQGGAGLGNVYVKLSGGTADLVLNIRGPQGPPGNSISRSARIQQPVSPAQVVDNTNPQIVSFGQLSWDTYNMTAAGYDRLYLPTHAANTNYYLVTAQVEFSAAGGTGREIYLEKKVGPDWFSVLTQSVPPVTVGTKPTVINVSTLVPVLPSSTQAFVECRVTAVVWGTASCTLTPNTWLSADWCGYT